MRASPEAEMFFNIHIGCRKCGKEEVDLKEIAIEPFQQILLVVYSCRLCHHEDKAHIPVKGFLEAFQRTAVVH